MLGLGMPHIQKIAAPIFFAGLYDAKPAWTLGLAKSWFTPVPIWAQDWKRLSRIRIATCPWFGCKKYTSVFSVNYDGSIGEPIVGWAGNSFDYIGDIWWDDRPWCWMVTSFLDGTADSNQTYTSDIAWNNANNTIETLGAGASGGIARQNTVTLVIAASGGGGGAYQKHNNFSFAVPGTTQATYQLGLGGVGATLGSGVTSSASGTAGGDTWFDGASYGVSTVGAKGGSGGLATVAGDDIGGASGGQSSSGRGNSTGYNGGNSGSVTDAGITGGGSAASLAGAGGNSPSITTNLSEGGSTIAGIAGGGVGTGAPGSGGLQDQTTAGDGHSGTEWDASHGSGGGGGSSGIIMSGSGCTGGAGSAYGGASGAAAGANNIGNQSVITLAGAKGLIVLNYAPSYSGVPNRLLRATYLRR